MSANEIAQKTTPDRNIAEAARSDAVLPQRVKSSSEMIANAARTAGTPTIGMVPSRSPKPTCWSRTLNGDPVLAFA